MCSNTEKEFVQDKVLETNILVNILVQIQPGEQSLLETIRELVKGTRYVVYPVTDKIFESSSWTGGCRLLVVPAPANPPAASVKDFLDAGGQVLKIEESTRSKIRDKLLTEGIAVTEDEYLEDNVPTAAGFVPGYFLSDSHEAFFHDSCIKGRLTDNSLKQGKLELKFCEPVDSDLSETTLFLHPTQSSPSFKFQEYLSWLKTRAIGRHVFNLPIISSSMLVLEGSSLCNGLVVVPDQQSQGRGRGANRWLSPTGCAMFSLQIHLDMNSSPLGRRPSLVQHMVGLAVATALRSFNKKLDVRLKWPNDIFYADKVKLGGVIVNSSVLRSSMVLNIGCGVNLANSEPTLSVNQLLRELNSPPASREQYLAEVFNTLERIIDEFDRDGDGEEKFFKSYYSHWLHGGQEVVVETSTLRGPAEKELDEREKVRITGIDEFGYLRAETKDGEEITVCDDGNSFDMMRGLIRPKFS